MLKQGLIGIGILVTVIALTLLIVPNLNSNANFSKENCGLSQNSISGQMEYSKNCEPSNFSPTGLFAYSQTSDQNQKPTIVNPSNLDSIDPPQVLQIIDLN